MYYFFLAGVKNEGRVRIGVGMRMRVCVRKVMGEEKKEKKRKHTSSNTDSPDGISGSGKKGEKTPTINIHPFIYSFTASCPPPKLKTNKKLNQENVTKNSHPHSQTSPQY